MNRTCIKENPRQPYLYQREPSSTEPVSERTFVNRSCIRENPRQPYLYQREPSWTLPVSDRTLVNRTCIRENSREPYLYQTGPSWTEPVSERTNHPHLSRRTLDSGRSGFCGRWSGTSKMGRVGGAGRVAVKVRLHRGSGERASVKWALESWCLYLWEGDKRGLLGLDHTQSALRILCVQGWWYYRHWPFCERASTLTSFRSSVIVLRHYVSVIFRSKLTTLHHLCFYHCQFVGIWMVNQNISFGACDRWPYQDNETKGFSVEKTDMAMSRRFHVGQQNGTVITVNSYYAQSRSRKADKYFRLPSEACSWTFGVHFAFFCERIVPQSLARDYAL